MLNIFSGSVRPRLALLMGWPGELSLSAGNAWDDCYKNQIGSEAIE